MFRIFPVWWYQIHNLSFHFNQECLPGLFSALCIKTGAATSNITHVLGLFSGWMLFRKWSRKFFPQKSTRWTFFLTFLKILRFEWYQIWPVNNLFQVDQFPAPTTNILSIFWPFHQENDYGDVDAATTKSHWQEWDVCLCRLPCWERERAWGEPWSYLCRFAAGIFH